MRIIKDLERFAGRIERSVVTVGEFDALHLGHLKLIRKVKELSKNRYTPVLVTFDPYPREVLLKRPITERLLTRDEKLNMLEALGIKTVAFIKFSRNFSKIDAEAFIRDYLVKKLGIKALVAGEDFSLGKGRRGNACLLRSLGRRSGFSFVPVRTLAKSGREIKSSSIREFIVSGRIWKAAGFLGRFYSLEGIVVRGRQRNIGFKTANLSDPGKLLPKDGIYATYSRLGRKIYRSITYIGRRPTFNGRERSIETNIFDFSKALYGRRLKIEFVKFLRDDRKFKDIGSLKDQIKKDIRRARSALR